MKFIVYLDRKYDIHVTWRRPYHLKPVKSKMIKTMQFSEQCAYYYSNVKWAGRKE